MYENTSQGTPISPAFATIEQLCHHLADNEVGRFGSVPVSFDRWMRFCRSSLGIGEHSILPDRPGFWSFEDDQGRLGIACVERNQTTAFRSDEVFNVFVFRNVNAFRVDHRLFHRWLGPVVVPEA